MFCHKQKMHIYTDALRYLMLVPLFFHPKLYVQELAIPSVPQDRNNQSSIRGSKFTKSEQRLDHMLEVAIDAIAPTAFFSLTTYLLLQCHTALRHPANHFRISRLSQKTVIALTLFGLSLFLCVKTVQKYHQQERFLLEIAALKAPGL